jgi:hypothetical protein
MTSASTLLRSLLVYGLCLPLAVFLGYLMATPMDPTTFAAVMIVLFILMIPLILRWHHAWLIASWNTTAVIFFLPGSPYLWMGMAALSLLMSILLHMMNRDQRFLWVPSITLSLTLLAVVVLVTARMTGGFGLRAFGSEVHGGRRYFEILAAIMGYFALTGMRVPPQRAALYVSLFFLGQATMAIGDLAGMISPAFNFLFLFFPVEDISALRNDPVGTAGLIMRSGGLTLLGMGVACAMLARYNLRGLFDMHRPFRLLAFLAFVFVGASGGFRSMMVELFLLIAALFCLEGLYRTRALPATITLAVLGGALLMGFAPNLPRSIQRSLAFLPMIPIDPVVKMDAKFSTEWRIQMWREVLPDVPHYLILGKGYSFDPKDLDMARMSARAAATAEGSEVVGDFHNGPLSVIIPFGIFGVIGFFWFLLAAGRVFYLNYKYGDAALKNANTFLFAFYIAKFIFFIAIFGSLYVDMAMFAGIAGLSVSLNGGVAQRPAEAPEPTPAINRLRLSPGLRKPVGV